MNENHTFNPICRALIIGASGGIGSALPKAINTAYGITDIVKISRSDDGLDITNEDSIKNLFESLDKKVVSYEEYRPPLVVRQIYKLDETYLI